MTAAPESRARLFVAVQPDADALHGMLQAIEPLRALPDLADLRWTEPEKLHFTLSFLGSVPLAAATQIHVECAEVAARVAPFSLTLAGGGAFPALRRASVLWVGATDGAPALCALAEQLATRLTALGFEREERAFKPHLTIARCKRPQPLTAAVAALATLRVETSVRELLLVRSHLGRPSARYEVLERCALTSAPAPS